jgi:hypothetical protein
MMLEDKQRPTVASELGQAVQKEFLSAGAKGITAGIVAGFGAAALGIWGYIATLPGSIGLVPKDAVVAFATECPTGWTEYKEGWGRFIVGAFSEKRRGEIPGGFAEDARGVDLTPRPFGDPGGEEMHQLTEAEMPSHNHEFQGKPVATGGWGDMSSTLPLAIGDVKKWDTYVPSGTITNTGGNQPHNKMPPFVSLYYCLKE